MTIDERVRETTAKALVGSESYGDAEDTIKAALIAAVEEEREACRQIALVAEKQSADLMKTEPAREGQEYYRGRGLSAALIAQRILARARSKGD